MSLGRRAVTFGPVEITRRMITRFGLAVALLGLSVPHLRGPIAVAPFNVALACLCEGVFAFIRTTGFLISERQAARRSLGHIIPSPRWPAQPVF